MGRNPRSAAPLSVQRGELEAIYRRYHHRRYISPDPLQTLGMFERLADREIAGLIAALLAYGNVKAIHRGIMDVLERIGPRPHEYLKQTAVREILRGFADFRYRVTDGRAMGALLVGVKRLLEAHGSVEASVVHHMREHDATVIPGVSGWVGAMSEAAGHPLNHLLPDPARGSACKRIMLYLRWMVRRDEIDPGGWTEIRPDQLIVPLDTHVYAVARQFGWTKRGQANLATAVEVTDALRAICPEDPLRYDFCLTRPGIRREPWPSQGKPIRPSGRDSVPCRTRIRLNEHGMRL